MSEKLSSTEAWRNILNLVPDAPPEALSLEKFEKMSPDQQEDTLDSFAQFNPGIHAEATGTELKVRIVE